MRVVKNGNSRSGLLDQSSWQMTMSENLGFARGAWPDTATPSRSAANTLARLRRRGAKRERGRRAS
jgi:hypothetical protein